MTDLHASPDLVGVDARPTDTAPDGLRRFRGSTVEEAIAAAKHDLGDELEIVEANRIRRGGLGGFFATDLGIEVIVAAPTPTESNTSVPGSTVRDSDPSAIGAVDRILDRHEANGGDRFVPSGADVSADDPDPHPFATQLARELSSSGVGEDSWCDVDPLDGTGSPGEAPTDARLESWQRKADSRPEPFDQESAAIDTSPASAPDDDALADIDQLLLRAGITPPIDPALVPADPAPATTRSSMAVAPAAAPLPPSDLITAAAERLSEQLAIVNPTTGRPHTLKKIQLKVSSPDGTSVEMIAEWNDDE